MPTRSQPPIQAGQPYGFAPALMTEIGLEMGIPSEFVVKPWSELIDDIKARRIDAIAAIGWAAEREPYIDYSVELAEMESAVFARKGGPGPKRVEDLGNSTVAMQKDGLVNHFFRDRIPESRIVFSTGFQTGLIDVATGKADLTIGA